jgi:multiple sugar transport system substrate-binding protein
MTGNTMTRRGWFGGSGALAASSVLAACGARGGGTTETQPQKALGPATVDFWMHTDQTFILMFNNILIPKFKEENPQLTLNLNVVPGSWDPLYEKIISSTAAGTPPDANRGKEFWAPDLAETGMLENLDNWIKGQKEITADKYHPHVWGIGRHAEKQWGIPLHYFVRPLFYNEALYEQTGLAKDGKYTVPNTWQEYADQGSRLTKKDQGVYGTQLYNYSKRNEDNVSHFQMFLASAGGEYVNKDRSKIAFNSPQGLEVLQFFVDLIFKYQAAKPADSTSTPEQGKVATWFNGAFAMPGYTRNNPDLRYGVAMMPKNKSRGVVIRGNNVYMYKDSKVKDATFKWFQFLTRDDVGLTYAKETAYPPARKANEEKDIFGSDPRWKTIIEQARQKENVYQPMFPGYLEGAYRFSDELVEAYTGKKTAKDALAAGAAAAQDALKPPK